MSDYPHYDMLSSVYLNSTGRSVHMKTRIQPQNEAEAKELEELQERGVCKKFVPQKPEEEKESNDEQPSSENVQTDPQDDIAEVAGVGAKTLLKLKAAGVTKRSQLKELALNDEEKLTEILGANNAAKFVKQFSEEEDNTEESNDEQPASSREANEEEEEDDENDDEDTEEQVEEALQ